ncbi:hypothetical protein AB5N19_08229 [Seiridium cardinale]
MYKEPWVVSAVLLFAGSCAASPAQEEFGPSIESALQNAPQIFNAVHNAMRQFGSSLHHNGMSFFQATIPTGTLLYHGAPTTDIPANLEWLAFEIEHAENFAHGRWRKAPNDDGDMVFQEHIQTPLQPGRQRMQSILNSPEETQTLHTRDVGSRWVHDGWIREPGYLQLYQAARPLNVLYLDGMAAGKTNMGTNDAEDYILTGNKTRHGFDDLLRAADLCNWARNWKIDGFVRMEPGFEVVYCDFQDGGLHQLSATRRSSGGYSREAIVFPLFKWLQAASKRYHGIGGSRVLIDYSSMVSAFFYPLNLTNPNTTFSEHPRLVAASESELANIKEHVERLTPKQRQRPASSIDWQGVTDMVVSRYADRLAFMATIDSIETMNMSLNHLLETFMDFKEEHEVDFADAMQKCASHYLAGAVPRTLEDELIFAGISGTTHNICQTLFEAHELVARNPNADDKSLAEALSLVHGLMAQLGWSKWKECGACKVDEICFIAMWPFGNVEDHYNPSCLNASTAAGRNTYWRWEWW